MISDFKYAFRTLAKSPGFTLVAVLTLALGIGANTAIFSVVEGALLRPLPFPHADRLVRIYEALDENGARSDVLNLSVARWRGSESSAAIFSKMLPVELVAPQSLVQRPVRRRKPSPPRLSPTTFLMSSDYRRRRAATSREEEGTDKAANVVIISDDFWRNTLNSRRDVLGSTIVIDGTPRTIIGVMPKAFRHPYRASLWLPLALEPDNPVTINNHYLYGVARLRPGITR